MKQNKSKRYIQIGFGCLVLVSILFSNFLYADSDVKREKLSSITLDWEEFRSILKLDKDEVSLSWDEFRKLLLQTGFRIKPEYRIEGGNVVLTREQFKKLLEQMKPPKKGELTPPCDYLIRKGNYNGVVGEDSTRFDAFLYLEIFKKDKRTYSKIPLFREELAIEDIRFDEKPASIITEGGWHYLNTSEVGRHLVKVKFSVKSSLDRGVLGLNFNIPQTPITHLTLDIPKANMDINIANAQELKITERNKHTIVRGYLTPATYMNISWRKKLESVVRGPAKIYAELFNLLSIEADAIRVITKVKLNIVQNKINSVTLVIPDGYQVLEVTGQGKSVWSIREDKGKEFLDIPFEYPIEEHRYLTINSEKLLPEETIVADFSGFQVLESERESGFIAGEVKSDAEANVQEFEGLNRVDFQNIPQELTSLSSRPVLFAFKYIHHPYNIVVDITKYEKEEALSAIIDSARGITLFIEEGKLVHQFTFSMRNLWNQFLKLELPEDTSIWSVYVDGKREKASKDSDGKVLIPLARSQRIGERDSLRPFNVELIYTEPVGKFAIFGSKEHIFPSPNVLINTLEWKLYLPVNYKYIHFGGNLKKEKIPKLRKPPVWEKISRVLSGLAGSSFQMAKQEPGIMSESIRPYGKKGGLRDRKRKELIKREGEVMRADKVTRAFKGKEDGKLIDYYISDLSEERGEMVPVPPEESKIAKPYMAIPSKKALSLGLAGLLSVRVHIPISGKDYLFSKKIIEKGEPLQLSFTYVNEWITKGLSILLILMFLYILFKIRKIFLPPIITLGKVLSKLLHLMKKCLRPKVLPIVIFFALVIIKLLNLYRYYPLLTIALVLLFLISLARLFKKQIIQILKFLWRPSISLLIIFLLLVILIITRLFLPFFPLFILLFIGFIVSVIRLVIGFVKKRKQMKEIKKEEASKRINQF